MTTACMKMVWKYLRKGKSVPRAYLNAFLSEEQDWHGSLIDIGGEKTSSYQGVIPLHQFERIDTVNINPKSGANIIADASAIPVADASHDRVLCLNLLEHVADHQGVVHEIARALKPGGVAHIYIPFLVRVHPDPTDFQRFAPQGVELMLSKVGLTHPEIRGAAGGPFIAGFSQIHFLFPRWLSLPLLWVNFSLDAIIRRLRPKLFGFWPVALYIKVQKPYLTRGAE